MLSSQRQEMKDALYNAAKGKDTGEEAANPLVQNGEKLIPSVTRVFSKDHSIYVYLQAYEQAAKEIEPLVAAVSFYRGQEKVFESRPIEARDRVNDRVNAIPLEFEIPLDKLAPGRYDCQVTVLNPDGRKAAFWQAPVMLVP